jgi:hypothetical protein
LVGFHIMAPRRLHSSGLRRESQAFFVSQLGANRARLICRNSLQYV